MRSSGSLRGRLLTAAFVAGAAVTAFAQSSTAPKLFNEARAREATVRRQLDVPGGAGVTSVLPRLRTLVETYQDLARLFPASAVADDALWHGGRLAADAFWQAGDLRDRADALRLFTALTTSFPDSVFTRQVPTQTARLERAPVTTPTAPASSPGLGTAAEAGGAALALPAPPPVSPPPAAPAPPQAAPARTARPARPAHAALTAIRREVLPQALRITLEVERETTFHAERLDAPARVFVDLKNTRAVEALKDAVLPYADGVVRQVRVGRQIDARTRVVFDLHGSPRHSVYALYDPYRIVIDFEQSPESAEPSSGAAPAAGVEAAPAPKRRVIASLERADRAAAPAPVALVAARAPVAVAAAAAAAPHVTADLDPVSATAPAVVDAVQPAPVAPAMGTSGGTSVPPARGPAATPPDGISRPPSPPKANMRGGYSLSRQLGLGIARIVIDPGHGGHDPGAKVRGLTEADLVLDVALRLEKLLAAQPGVEVVLTRRNNSYVSLEDRTDIANRADADLFLSIHANASADARATGIESYFLNFAPDRRAAAAAARENAASGRAMRHLGDIVKAIALDNKRDESRDLATTVQAALHGQARRSNRELRNLGVKQAPFMVLIGATMPSVLTEIAFITNRQEAALLKTDAYRQQLALGLLSGITRYQQALKQAPAVAQN